MTRPLVYVAGPYKGNAIGEEMPHTHRACKAGYFLKANGFMPLIPHLLFPLRLIRPSFTEDDIMEMCLDYLYRCDAVLRIEGVSNGAELECEYARLHGIPVFECHESEFCDRWAKWAKRERGDAS